MLAGWLLLGWGLFNVAEGIVDHHLLGIHHVREGANQTAWDLAFLAFGALLLIGGWLLTRKRDDELAEGQVVDLGTARHVSDRGHGRRTTRPDTSERAGRR